MDPPAKSPGSSLSLRQGRVYEKIRGRHSEAALGSKGSPVETKKSAHGNPSDIARARALRSRTPPWPPSWDSKSTASARRRDAALSRLGICRFLSRRGEAERKPQKGAVQSRVNMASRMRAPSKFEV